MTTANITAGARILHMIPVEAEVAYVVKAETVREATDEYLEVYGIRGIHRTPPMPRFGWMYVQGSIYATSASLLLAAVNQLFVGEARARAIRVIAAHERQEAEAAERRRLHEATEPAVHVGGPHDGRTFTAAGDEGGRSYETTTGRVHTGQGPEPRYYDVYRRTTDRDHDGRVIFRHEGVRS